MVGRIATLEGAIWDQRRDRAVDCPQPQRPHPQTVPLHPPPRVVPADDRYGRAEDFDGESVDEEVGETPRAPAGRGYRRFDRRRDLDFDDERRVPRDRD